MPRIRTYKPSFFRSEDVAALTFRARLTWLGLWPYCDDEGRMKDNTALIKGDVWPLDDVSVEDIEADLAELAKHGRIVRYVVDGRRYLQVTNWHQHQKIQKPSPSNIPAPSANGAGPLPPGSGSDTTDLPEQSDTATPRRGREGKGREGTREAPSPRCQQHVDNPHPPPCGRCKDARVARERWDAQQATRDRDEMLTRRKCGLCDADGWRLTPGSRIPLSPYERCDHRPLRSVS
jgi:hypothetical protein